MSTISQNELGSFNSILKRDWAGYSELTCNPLIF